MLRALSLCAAVVAVSPSHADVIYVDADAPGIGDGQTWQTAYQRLVDAVAAAGPGDEVWIAEGVYLPVPTPGFYALRAGVALYGGFEGGEATLDERDPAVHLTVIDGDTNGDDGPGFTNRSDNAVTLVEIAGTDPGTRLDGLVFTGGFANTGAFLEGGAVRAFGGELTIDGCLFIDNGAKDFGGSVYLTGMESVEIRDTIFTLNSTNPNSQQFETQGGAVWFQGGDLRMEGCAFLANQAVGDTFSSGGALWADADALVIERTSFTQNHAEFGGGGAVSFDALSADFALCRFVGNTVGGGGGAIRSTDFDTDERVVRIASCEFLGNAAGYGGAIGLGTGSSLRTAYDLRMSNSVVAGNFTAQEGIVSVYGNAVIRQSTIANNLTPSMSGLRDSAAVYLFQDTDLLVENTILSGNNSGPDVGQDAQVLSESGVVTANHCIIQGWDGTLAGAGSFDADPMFTNPDGPDGTPGTTDDRYRLAPGSPAIDASDNGSVPIDLFDVDDDGDTSERLPLDIYGDPRRRDDASSPDTGAGNAPIVDIGAAEYQFNSCVSDLNGDGLLDLADITAFVTAFSVGDPAVDFDLNGLYDLADIVLFVGFFNAGCP